MNYPSHPTIEIVNADVSYGHARYALFDFDGTLSLIRAGWQGVMTELMFEILKATPIGQHEPQDALKSVVDAYISRLTGKQTIYQMIRLCKEIRKRGGHPLDPLTYKRQYHDRLDGLIGDRVKSLESGARSPESFLVRSADEFLSTLREAGIECFLASGTDKVFVNREAQLLGIAPFFSAIYGALDDWRRYSKRKVIRGIFRENGLLGNEFVSFGDGFVEIEETKAVGGVAVGVASDELNRRGVDPWKRDRLIAAGADIIVPDFACYNHLLSLLFGDALRAFLRVKTARHRGQNAT